jgi:hypothetical protein
MGFSPCHWVLPGFETNFNFSSRLKRYLRWLRRQLLDAFHIYNDQTRPTEKGFVFLFES